MKKIIAGILIGWLTVGILAATDAITYFDVRRVVALLEKIERHTREIKEALTPPSRKPSYREYQLPE